MYEKMKPLAPESLEKLFLFEVYVEKLSIDYPKLCFTQNFLNTLKETVIQFQFLGFQPVEIKEEEFMGEEIDCGDRKVNAGKSCLFSLRDLPRAVRSLEIDVKVLRKTDQDCFLPLAATSIKLDEQFADILKTSSGRKRNKSLKKPFTLYDARCNEIGRITVNINLSCFGKIITTSFQLDGEDSKAYVVQPGGEIPVADFLKSEPSFNKGICPQRHGYYPNASRMNMTPSYPAFQMPPGGLLGGFPLQPSMPQFPGSYPGQRMPVGGVQGGMWGAGQWGMGGAGMGWMGQQPLGGLLGGAPAYGKESSDSSSSEEPPPPPPFQICSCDYPMPAGFSPPAPVKKKKKKKKNNCPMGMMKDFCMNPMCPKGYPQLPIIEEKQQVCQAMEVPPGVIGMKGEQMVFQLPSDSQPIPGNKKARYNLGGGLNNNLKDVRIMNDGETKKHGVPNKLNDIFVIKVGKTNQETDQRQKMILEVKQPRPPVDDRTFYDIRTQYLETDFMTEPPKKEKGKGKGKKDKKGKGKKGKKK